MPIDTTDNANKQNNSIITNEIDHFNQLADQWWDRKGPMSSLHDMNDLRIEWINRNLRHNNQYYKSGNILDTTPLLPNGGSLTYKVGSIEELVHENQHFSVITALELLEHVNDPQNFIHNISRLLQTNGMIFVSTINRTLPAFLFAKVAAEYITRKLPVGTHNWRQFITPSELGKMAYSAGLRIKSIAGMTFYPNGWKLTQNVKINYIACLTNS